nr:PREDICTED: uncharacterized protein LOC109042790 [Bemisia tabaci]
MLNRIMWWNTFKFFKANVVIVLQGLISGDINKVPTSSNSKIKAYLKDQFAKLMTTCIILRIADFNVHKVPFKRRSNSVSQAFIKGHRRRTSKGIPGIALER